MANKIIAAVMWRQGDDLQPRSRTPQGLLADAQASNARVMIADVAQGKKIQGTFSHTGIDFPTVDAVTALGRYLYQAGYRLWPMVNVLAEDPEGEAELHASITNLLSQVYGEPVPLVADFERYDGFFDPSRPDVNGERYFKRLMALLAAPPFNNPLIACIDPRQPDREYGVGLLPAGVPLMLQTYPKAYQQSVDFVFNEWYNKPKPWTGRNPVLPMMDGDSATSDIRRAFELTAGKFPMLTIWGFGSLVYTPNPDDVDDFTVIKEFAADYTPFIGGVAPTPGPGPTPGPTGFNRAGAWDQIAALANAFRGTNTHGDLVTAGGLDSEYQASKVMWGADQRE